ncbi:hypothetical protein ACWDBD_17465 [Streptomyces sp. NPDC001118]
MSEPTPESTPTAAQPASDPAPAATPAPTSAPEPPAAPPQQPSGGQEPSGTQQQAANVDELPAWAQREFKKLRDEAAGNRVKAKEVNDALAQFKADQETQRQAMAKALGFAPDEPPTAEQLTEQLNATKAERDAQQARARQTAVELAVFRAAAAEQVDGNALLDSRAFVAALDGLDPSADNFGQQVKAAIAAAAESNPRYKLEPATPPPPAPPAPPAVPKSGSEFGAPPQGPRQWTEEDVARSTPAQLQKAINDGLLENLGFGPRRAARR